MQATSGRPTPPVSVFRDSASERHFLLRIPCPCGFASACEGVDCSLCRGEREQLLTVPEWSLKAEHIGILLPRDRVAAIRSICLRGDWRKAWSECLRIALARSEDVRAGEQTDDDGPLRLRSLVNRALEVAAWRALAQFCRELGDTP